MAPKSLTLPQVLVALFALGAIYMLGTVVFGGSSAPIRATSHESAAAARQSSSSSMATSSSSMATVSSSSSAGAGAAWDPMGGKGGIDSPIKARAALTDFLTTTCAELRETRTSIVVKCAPQPDADCRRLYDRAMRLFGLVYQVLEYDESRVRATCSDLIETEHDIYETMLRRYAVQNREMDRKLAAAGPVASGSGAAFVPIYVMNNHGYAQRYWTRIFPTYQATGQATRPNIVHVDSHFDMNSEKWTPAMEASFRKYKQASGRSTTEGALQLPADKTAPKELPWVFQGSPWPVGQVFHRFARQLVVQSEWVSTPEVDVEFTVVIIDPNPPGDEKKSDHRLRGGGGDGDDGDDGDDGGDSFSSSPASDVAYCAAPVMRDGTLPPLPPWRAPAGQAPGAEAAPGAADGSKVNWLDHNVESYLKFIQTFPDVAGTLAVARSARNRSVEIPLLISEDCGLKAMTEDDLWLERMRRHKGESRAQRSHVQLPFAEHDTFDYSFITLNGTRDDSNDYERIVSKIEETVALGPKGVDKSRPWILDIDLDFFSCPGVDWQGMFFENLETMQTFFKNCRSTVANIKEAMLSNDPDLPQGAWTPKAIKDACFRTIMAYGAREKEAERIIVEAMGRAVGLLHRRGGEEYSPDSESTFVHLLLEAAKARKAFYTTKLDARLERFHAVLQGLKKRGLRPAGVTLVDSTAATATGPLPVETDEAGRDGGNWLDADVAVYVHMRVMAMLEEFLGQGASLM